jgi:hypothetical protein
LWRFVWIARTHSRPYTSSRPLVAGFIRNFPSGSERTRYGKFSEARWRSFSYSERAAKVRLELFVNPVSEVGKGRQAHTGQTRRLPLIPRPLPLRTDHSLSEHSSRVTAGAVIPHFQRVAPVIPTGVTGVFLCYETGLPHCILLTSPVGLLGMTVSAMNAHYSATGLLRLTPRPIKPKLDFLLHFVTSSAPGCPQGHDSYHYMPPATPSPVLIGRGAHAPRQTQWRDNCLVQFNNGRKRRAKAFQPRGVFFFSATVHML